MKEHLAVIKACSFKQYDIKFAEILYKMELMQMIFRPTKRTKQSKSALMASKTGKLDLVELLLKMETDINYQNEYGQSALSECVMVERYNVSNLPASKRSG